MNRFFIYKEYGAKYELMMKDIACANSSMPEWDSYQRGLEALASTLGSAKGTGESSKKSLTVSDLLVKVSRSTNSGIRNDAVAMLMFGTAYSEGLQVSPVICRTPQIHSS
jgi:hypothetical protein